MEERDNHVSGAGHLLPNIKLLKEGHLFVQNVRKSNLYYNDD